jgi:serine/threonine-protein kinase
MLESLAAALADRYTIGRELGAGGMGTVYLARELKHDREVALKVLRPEIASHIGVVRFFNEVKITAKLDHPHILTLIDSGESGDFLWYVQPFVRGESLRAKLDREKQLSIEEAVAIARQVAGALDHAHQRGVVHRDSPRIFCCTKARRWSPISHRAASNRLTRLRTGYRIGTPQYMSQQATGGAHRRAQRTHTGRGPVRVLSGNAHTAPTMQALIAKLLTNGHARRHGAPGACRTSTRWSQGALMPADRFATAAELASALQGSGSFIAAEPSPAGSRRRAVWIGATIGGVLLVAGAGAAVMLRSSAPALAIGRTEQITADPGLEIQPSLSPDGRLVAYAAGTPSQMRIFIRPVGSGGGRTIPLSDDSSLIETQPLVTRREDPVPLRGRRSVAPRWAASQPWLLAPRRVNRRYGRDGRENAFVRGTRCPRQ